MYQLCFQIKGNYYLLLYYNTLQQLIPVDESSVIEMLPVMGLSDEEDENNDDDDENNGFIS